MLVDVKKPYIVARN